MGVFRQFPYSNFHEMNMDEIIKIVKNMLEEWAQYHAEWDAWMDQMNDDWSNYQEVMNTAWQNMQNFINNYFDNLDVQTEINNKITSMVNTGEFADIVAPYIPPRVTEWLTAHITEPEGVVIDTSLSVEGACADAKATGDAIGEVRSDLELTYDGQRTMVGAGSFARGGLDVDTTLLATQHWRVSNDMPMTFDHDITISVRPGFRWGYDIAGVSNSWQGWFTTPTTIPADTSFVLQIARITENTSEYADVYEFCRALTYGNDTYYLARANKLNLIEFEDYVNPYYDELKDYDNNFFFKPNIFSISVGSPTINSVNPLTVTVPSAPGGVRSVNTSIKPNQTKICLDIVEESAQSMRATIAFFDISNSYISQVDQDAAQGKAFICASIPVNAVKWSVFFTFYTASTYTFKSINVYYYTEQIKIKTLGDVIQNELGVMGLKWSAMGDSLTAQSTLGTNNRNYVDYVGDSLGLNAINLGWGGTGYINDGGTSHAFWQRYNTIDSDTNILTVFGSLNDLDSAYNNIGGLKDENTTTLYGCMNAFINGVYSINPGMRIGMILPTPWEWMNRRYPGEITTLKTEQYINALIEFAKFNSIPVLNLFDESGMHPWDESFRNAYYKNSDGTHPNSAGHYKFIYPKVKAFILELLSK